MSIDSKEKRASILGVARPWMRDKFPTSDKDEQWRIASGNAYGGNTLITVTGFTRRSSGKWYRIYQN